MKSFEVGARVMALMAFVVLIYVVLDLVLPSADPERTKLRASLRMTLATVDAGFTVAIARAATPRQADKLVTWALWLTCGLALGTWSLDVERLAAVSFAFTWINFGILSFVPGPWTMRWQAAAAFTAGFVAVLLGHGLPAGDVLPVLPLVAGSWLVGGYFGRDLERMRRNAWGETERLAELLDATPTPTLLLHDRPGWPLDRCNAAAANRLGLDVAAARGRPLPLVIRDPEAGAELDRRLADVDVGIARIRVTASAGLSQVNRAPEPEGGRLAPPIEAALARADAALYASKGAGRDQVHILRTTHHGLRPERLDLVGPS